MILVSLAVVAQNKGELPFTSSSPEAKTLLRQAWATFADVKLEEGNKLVAQALEKDPNFGMAHFSYFTTNVDEQNQNLEKALSATLSEDEKMFLNGVKANRNKQSPREYFDPLLKKYPKDDVLGLWMIFNNADRNNRVELGESIAKRSPKFAPAYNLLGYAYMDLNDMAKAEANFNKYMSLRPDLANVYDSKGDYLVRNSKFQEASLMFDKAVSLGMVNSGIKAQRARARVKFPRPSEAEFSEMKQLVANSTQALVKSNIDEMMQQHADQCIEIFGSQVANVGASNIRRRLLDLAQNNQFLKSEVRLENIDGIGPISVGWGPYESATKANASGQVNETKGNAIFVFRKQTDGPWKIVTVHFVPGEQPEAEDDGAKVRQVITTWNNTLKPNEAFAEEHANALGNLYSAQAVEMLPSQRSNIGIANLKARWSGFYGMKLETNSLGPINVDIIGRRAVAWGMGIQNGYAKDSKELFRVDFPWVMIFTKERDDVWRILAVNFYQE
jgi:ketosteroid isomerase-like protein